MIMFYLLIFLVLICFLPVQADQWAVLVAGSSGIYNYRHQADVCHAYQIFHENGFPDSHIIVMMYDDIAYHPANPLPGVILNKVGGNNVYVDVPKDYIGEQVTSQNFLSVLAGNSTGKKVLNTGTDDDIFIYFTDHGGPGIILFPNGELYAHELIDTLDYMYRNKKYRSLVFYLEACESGSMFNNLLPPDHRIFAMTASNPMESSFACCYDETVNNYLGDTFSVNWLENADSFEALLKETLIGQYHLVENETLKSHVCLYGDASLSNNSLAQYLIYHPKNYYLKRNSNNPLDYRRALTDLVDSRDVKNEYLIRNYYDGNNLEQLNEELRQEQILKKLYGELRKADSTCYPTEKIDTYCLQDRVRQYKQKHGSLTNVALKYLRRIAADCIQKRFE